MQCLKFVAVLNSHDSAYVSCILISIRWLTKTNLKFLDPKVDVQNPDDCVTRTALMLNGSDLIPI